MMCSPPLPLLHLTLWEDGMFDLNKNSLLITCPVSATIQDIKDCLKQHDLYLGYHPLSLANPTLSECLQLGSINLYHYKFGSLLDLCVGIESELDNADTFASGPDDPNGGANFSALVASLPSHLSKITSATLKITVKPEKIQAMIIQGTQKRRFQFIHDVLSRNIAPLFWRLTDSEALLIGLSGVIEAVDAEVNEITQWAEQSKLTVKALDIKSGAPLLKEQIYALKNHPEILKQYALIQKTHSPTPPSKNPLSQIVLAEFDTPEYTQNRV